MSSCLGEEQIMARDVNRLSRVKVIVSFMVAVLQMGVVAHAAPTINSPDYRKPILDPSSQTNKWSSIIPNALAGYFTYTPYTTADAVKLGFPPSCGRLPDDPSSTEDCYTITVKKFQQALDIHGIFGGGEGLLNASGAPFGPVTWVFGYGSGGVGWAPPGAPGGVTVTGNAPKPFTDGTYATTGIWHFPAPTIKGTKGRPVRVTWLNELPNEIPTGFDPTICDDAPYNCYPYNRIVTHVHGAHTNPDSDGFAKAWYTPRFAEKGPDWVSTAQHGPEGTYRYPMDQPAGTIWYHDHAMGLTHNNTNMGLAGFFPITDDNEKRLQGVGGTKYLPTGDYELGFALQDRIFYNDGQLAMPDTPIIAAADLATCTYTYQADGTITPDVVSNCSSTPLFMKDPAKGHLVPYERNGTNIPLLATSTTLEFFGNMPVVNGVVYGKYDVEPRVYRMRFIGGTDSRTFIPRLKVVGSSPATYLPFYQIGSEQGFLNNPLQRENFVLMPGERIDVLVDFNGLAGKQVMMENLGPDFPYGGPSADFSYDGDGQSLPSLATPIPYDPNSNPEAIENIMMFDVSLAKSSVPDVPAPATSLNLRPISPAITANSITPTPGTPVRKISLMEITDQFGRTMPTIDARGFNEVAITERPRLNDTEIWEIINTTADSHPMHLHLVSFQLINREDIATTNDPAVFIPPYKFTPPDTLPGVLSPPDYEGSGVITTPTDGTATGHEFGFKDTIVCPPGKVTRVKAKFDLRGMYVWHCHILSHEEHDMMRPFFVGDPDGDVNGDGTVDISDALQSLKIGIGLNRPSSTQLVRGDVGPLLANAPKPDGKIDLSDALLILQKAIGQAAW